MTIVWTSGTSMSGLSGDTKPTTVPANTKFFETDTDLTFNFNGSTWDQLGGGSSQPEVYFPSGLLTVSGSISANDSVYLSANNTIAQGTSANAQKVIGIMTVAKSDTQTVNADELLIYGVTDFVCDGTVSAGDSLVQGTTAGRLGAENSVTPTFTGSALSNHSHEAFRHSGNTYSIDGAYFGIQGGDGTLMNTSGGSSSALSLPRTTTSVSGSNILNTSSSSAGTPTGTISSVQHSRIVAVALESGTVGETKKCLVSLRG